METYIQVLEYILLTSGFIFLIVLIITGILGLISSWSD